MVKKKKAAKKKRKLTKKRTQKGKAKRGSYDWEILKRRFFAHEWKNLEEMFKKERIPFSTGYKACNGWLPERQQLDKEAADRVYELIVQDRVKLIREMDARQYQMAIELQVKAGNQLLAKVKDKATGAMVHGEFSSQAVALAAFRLGAALEQQLLLRRGANPDADPIQPGSAPAVFTGANLFIAGGSAPSTADILARMREFRDEDLAAIIDAPETNGSRDKKAGSDGAAGEEAGKK